MPASKLTDKTLEQLCHYLKRGHLKRSACALVGIHRDTLHQWEKLGRELRELRDHPPLRDDYPTIAAHRKARAAWNRKLREGRLYLRVVDEVELAWDHGEGWLVEQTLRAAESAPAASGKPQRWQAYVTILERTRREQWHRSASVEHSTPDGRPFQIGTSFDPGKLSDDELAALRLMLEKARPEEG